MAPEVLRNEPADEKYGFSKAFYPKKHASSVIFFFCFTCDVSF